MEVRNENMDCICPEKPEVEAVTVPRETLEKALEETRRKLMVAESDREVLKETIVRMAIRESGV